MAVIRINSFGGEVPSATARTLPEGAAVTASGLLPSTKEFRPLGGDEQNGVTTYTNAVVLFRPSVVEANGAWLTATSADTSFAEGKVESDGSQWVYYCDGSSAPMVKDVATDGTAGTPWQLGVPAPTAAPTVATTQKAVITLSELDTWLNDTVLPTVKTQCTSRITDSRTTSASPSVPSGLTADGTSPWNMIYSVDTATAALTGLNDPQLGPVINGGNTEFRLSCRPLWPSISGSFSLGSVAHPVSGTTGVLSSVASALDTAFLSWFSATDPDVKVYTDRLTQLVANFKAAFAFTLTSAAAPTAPTKPTDTPEFVPTEDGTGTVPNPAAAWVTYRSDLATYNTNLTTYNTNLAKQKAEIAARNARIVAIQLEAANVMQQVESIYALRREALEDNIKSFFTALVTTTKADFSNGGTETAVNTITIAPERVRETRFYVVTAVNSRGEESAPSPASAMLDIDQYYTITVTRPTLATGRGISHWRLYRSNSSAASVQYQFVAEIAEATTSHSDTKDSSDLGESLSTTGWLEPVTGMKGLTGMANGILAAFKGSTVYFSELWVPYAWPTDYQYTVSYPIVGLAAFGQTLFVATKGVQYTFTGSDPASMNVQEIPGSQSCISARSIAALETAVIYASPDGLCLCDFNGIKVLTKDLFSRKDWQSMTPAGCVGAVHDNCYVFFFEPTTGVGSTVGYSLSLDTGKLVRFSFNGTAKGLFSHRVSDRLYALVYRALGTTPETYATHVDSLFTSSTLRSATFKTGILSLPSAQPMAWLQVLGEQNATAPAVVKLSRGADYTNALSTSQVVALSTHQVSLLSTAPMRLPPGIFVDHQLEITSSARIASVVLAGSTEELKQV